MIIARTPLRISFFGGGTDFPEFFQTHGGAVLGTAIDKSIYHTVNRFHSTLFDYSMRLAYRQVECVRQLDEVQHRPFREILRHFGVQKDVEITLAADLPSYSGLGSSSSFTVGLIKTLAAHRGKFISTGDLARLAIHIERNVLEETVGWQDQIFAAYGGLNLIEFRHDGDFAVHRIAISKDRREELDRSLLLYFTGITRRASDVEKNKIKNLAAIQETLRRMHLLVDRAHGILTGNESLSEFGQLLDTTWQEKRRLDPGVSNPDIDEMYATAMAGGALGGKLLGAGGGGFMVFFVPPERQESVRARMTRYHEIPFSMNASGSSIIHS
jgi:D-glycero-alpha-D-manno-heptose-7-phosphate kinase